jgi:DNA-binding transcriptional MerR regulator
MSSETRSIEEMLDMAQKLLEGARLPKSSEYPHLDLYMDQVTTYLEQQLGGLSRHPGDDKILTKTMINNYAKAGLLNPPVRKKYSADHLLQLVFIYMMKNFLTINDVQKILDPVKEVCFTEEQRTGHAPKKGEEDPAPKETFARVYDELEEELSGGARDCIRNIEDKIRAAGGSFEDADPSVKAQLQQFDAICRIAADIYVRKLYLEKLLDSFH